MFGDRYFGPRYWGNRYFAVGHELPAPQLAGELITVDGFSRQIERDAAGVVIVVDASVVVIVRETLSTVVERDTAATTVSL